MIIGIDPGFGRTGVVITEDSGDPIVAATFSADSTLWPDQKRAWDLASRIWTWVSEQQRIRWDKGTTHPNEKVTLVIERPILGKNPDNLIKQMRVFVSIITAASIYVDAIKEVNPTAMKKAVTGNGAAKKIDVVNASPFDGPGNWGPTNTEATKNQEAIADAWGIAICHIKKAWDEQYAPRSSYSEASLGPLMVWRA